MFDYYNKSQGRDCGICIQGRCSLNPFAAKGFPTEEVKSSGVRQSKIYKCPMGTYGSERGLKLKLLIKN